MNVYTVRKRPKKRSGKSNTCTATAGVIYVDRSKIGERCYVVAVSKYHSMCREIKLLKRVRKITNVPEEI